MLSGRKTQCLIDLKLNVEWTKHMVLSGRNVKHDVEWTLNTMLSGHQTRC